MLPGSRKINLVISSLGPGGAERVAAELANFWAAQGHAVSIATFSRQDTAPFYPLHGQVRLAGLDLLRPPSVLPARLFNFLRRVLTLRKYLETERPDIVISFLDQTNILTAAASTGTGIPVIVSEHADPWECPPGFFWSILRKLLYPSARAMVAVNHTIADHFRGVVRRVHVIPNPVSAAACNAETTDRATGNKLVISMGRFTREKGFDLLINAFTIVHAAHPDWKLEIWGDGPLRPGLEKLVADSGLAQNISMPGITDRPFEKLRAASLYVLPSRSEGFGNVILEAMACGLPVISFDCPSGPRELITSGKNGILVPCEDVPALGAAINGLITNDAQRDRLAAGGRATIPAYAVVTVAHQWEILIKELLPAKIT